jgi:hypothetical protein
MSIVTIFFFNFFFFEKANEILATTSCRPCNFLFFIFLKKRSLLGMTTRM